MKLDGKVAVVTGGGKGIGRAISLVFAREGADVVVTGRTESALKEVASEIEKMGRRSLAVVANLADPKQPDILINKALEKFERIDILVNNAGIAGPIMDVSEMDLEGWDELLAVNLTAVMLCTKFAVRDMLMRKSGVIINISSGVGRKGMAKRSAYASSKFGLIGFTQSLALEVGKHGIRVNCIAPGAVSGERLDRVLMQTSRQTGNTYEALRRNIERQTAMNRLATQEEVAATALFLAGDDSSGITGQTINCDAGIEMD